METGINFPRPCLIYLRIIHITLWDSHYHTSYMKIETWSCFNIDTVFHYCFWGLKWPFLGEYFQTYRWWVSYTLTINTLHFRKDYDRDSLGRMLTVCYTPVRAGIFYTVHDVSNTHSLVQFDVNVGISLTQWVCVVWEQLIVFIVRKAKFSCWSCHANDFNKLYNCP